ncbi:MAG: hypothetical protein A2Y33_02550 [Spirochaetes bacterium GWF1_51_8]|nr:MAG: hypothetical protein A2Y33_02550 [Spirochaetes bacterium GWF1_51_8]
MEKDLYRLALEKSPVGFAYHKIVLDDNNRPIDYEFLDINPAFRVMTGLDDPVIVGKTVTEVIPGIKNGDFDWVSFYAEVAMGGGEKEFEQYSLPLDRWYRVNVFSPEKLHFITFFTDISGVKNNERMLEITLQSIGDAVIATDAKGKVTSMNKKAEEYTAWTSEEAKGRDLTDVFQIVNSESGERVLNPVEIVLRSGRIQNLANHTVLIDRNRQRRQIADSAAPITDENGMIYGVVMVFRDVTTEYEAQKEIESFAKFPGENPNPVMRVSAGGLILFSNAAAMRDLQIQKDQLVDNKWVEIIKKCMDKNKPFDIEYEIGMKIFLLVFAPVTGNGYINVYGIDITERENNHRLLAINERKYSTLFNNIQDYIMRYDREFRHIDANIAALSVTGKKREEYIGLTHREMGFPDELCGLWEKSIGEVFRTGNPESVIFEWESPDGSIYLDLKFFPELNEQGEVETVLGVSRDITERMRLQAEQEKLLDLLNSLWFLVTSRNVSIKSIADHVLKETYRITESEFSFYGFISDDETKMKIYAWSDQAMEQCAMSDKPFDYKISDAGIWAEAVRERKTVIVNDYAKPDSRKRGLPGGHVPITRLVSVPIFSGEKIVAIAAVANKKTDYTQTDVHALESFLYNAQILIDRQKQEDAIKANETRLEGLLRISRYESGTVQEFLDFALEEIIGLTESRIGYIYFYNEEKKELRLNTWSKDVMKECTVAKPQTLYYLEKTGFWGEAIRQRRPIINNNFTAPNELKKGIPEGHVELKKFLTIPVMIGRRIVAVVGVANKENDYTDSDVRQLILLMDSVWKDTEMRKAENELRKSEERLSLAAKTVRLGIWETNIPLNETTWNSEMYGIFGMDKNTTDTSALNIVDFVHPDDRNRFAMERENAFRNGVDYDLQIKIVRPNGEERHVRTLSHTYEFEDGKPAKIIGVFDDITDQVNTYNTIIRNQRLNAIGEFASGVAHDFNNSLESILGNIELLFLNKGTNDETRDTLQSMKKSVSDASARIKKLQSFNKPSANKSAYVEINLNDVIADVIAQTRPLWKDSAEQNGVYFDIVKNLNAIPDVSGNESELRSAVYNLLKNSVEAMPKGGKIEITTGINDGFVEAAIADNGIGMDEETAAKVFQPFFTTKGYELGRGLGMSGVYSVIQDHKGDIEIARSVPGEGTLIRFRLPVSKNRKLKTPPKPEPVGQTKRLQVLWVDDEQSIRQLGQRRMEMLGHLCDTAENGEKAIRMIQSNPYDLIITDIGMPVMNGWQLIDRVRSMIGVDIEIAVLSGGGEDQLKEMKSGEKEVYILNKPIEIEKLSELLETVVAGKK